jgi:hypothetical protein
MKIEIPDREHVTATVPIRFCLSQGEVESVQRLILNNEAVRVLLVVRHLASGQEKRQLLTVPLEPMTYVSFTASGLNQLYAVLVAHKDAKDLEKYFLKSGDKQYSYENNLVEMLEGNAFRFRASVVNKQFQVMDWPRLSATESAETKSLVDVDLTEQNQLAWGSGPADNDNVYSKPAALKVDVPREYFAKDLPAWLVEWANLWYRLPLREQCDFRKRIPVIVFVQPPVMLVVAVLYVVFKFVALPVIKLGYGLIGLSFGYFQNNFRPILNSEEMFEMWNWSQYRGRAKNPLWYDENGDPRGGWQRIFTPIFWLVPLLGGWWFNRAYSESFGLGLLTVLMAEMILALIIRLIDEGINYLNSEDVKAAREESAKRAREVKLEQELGTWSCSQLDVSEFSPRLLLRSQRTIKLRFLGTKAKVCLPYSQN